jgi:MSHA biogenesis protein MshG
MGSFVCKTRDADGAVVETTVEASSEREALLALEESGLVPIRIKSASAATPAPRRSGAAAQAEQAGSGAVPSRSLARRKLSPKQLLQFSMQLGSALQAGVPVLSALRQIARQAGDRRQGAVLRGIVLALVADIEGGMPLSDAMRRFPRAFPELYVSTIAAGERTGSMDQALFNLTDYIEGEMELRSQIRSALLYPTIVIGALCLAVTVLIVFIVPRFAVFYSGFKTELPLPTRVLVGGSSFVSAHALWIAIALAGVAIVLARVARAAPVRARLDRWQLRIPVIGGLIDTAVTLRVVQMLGVTMQAGLPLLEGLELMATSTSNTKYRKELRAVVQGIAAGETLSASMDAAGCFRSAARQMLASGESTGSLGVSCDVLARHMRKELRYQTKDLTTLIEPLLTLVLAGVVLFVALAAFLPMWDMAQVVGK